MEGNSSGDDARRKEPAIFRMRRLQAVAFQKAPVVGDFTNILAFVGMVVGVLAAALPTAVAPVAIATVIFGFASLLSYWVELYEHVGLILCAESQILWQ